MDCNELFEEDVEEVIDGEDVEEVIDGEDVGDDEDNESDEDTGVDIEDDDNSERKKPMRDDSTYIFSLHKGSVFCCHLEPKTGGLAVTGAEDDMAYVWETHSGDVVLHCTGHKDSVTCVKFNHDGSYVATGDMSGVVQVWKIASKSRVWETHVGDLTWLKWHHGANVLLAGTVLGDAYMWRIPGGDCKLLSGSGVRTDCGLVLPDGKRAAVGYEDGAVKVFDMKAGTVLHHVPQGQAHTGNITDMDCHPDNNLLITAGVDGRAVVFKTQTGKVALVLDCKGSSLEAESDNSSVEAVGFCRVSNYPLAATGSLGGVLCIWDISQGILRHRSKQGSGITKLVWVKIIPYLFTSDLDGIIRLYDGRSCTLLTEYFGHSNCILDISCSMDFRYVLTSSDDGTARIFSPLVPRCQHL